MTDEIPKVTDVDGKQNTQVAVSDALEQVQTAFDDISVINRKTDINIQSSAGTSVLRDVIDTTGSAAVTNNTSDSGEITLTTGTTAGSTASIETGAYGQYVAGYVAQQGMGVRLPQTTFEDGQVARWGYFNGENGFYWGYDDQGLFVARLRNGSVKEKRYRENWNVNDPDERRDTSSFDVSEGAIYHIDFAWYGYGVIEFSIISAEENQPQKTAIVHRFSVDGETSITNPNQPIRATVDNGTTTDNIELELGGRQFSILGERSNSFRLTSDSATGVSVGSTGWEHVLTFKRASSATRRTNIELDGFTATTDGDTQFAVVWDANISGTSYSVPSLTPASETEVVTSTAGTFDGIGDGRKIWSTVSSGGKNARGTTALQEFSYAIPRETPVTVLAQGIGSSVSVDTTLRVREMW